MLVGDGKFMLEVPQGQAGLEYLWAERGVAEDGLDLAGVERAGLGTGPGRRGRDSCTCCALDKGAQHRV